MNRLLLTLTFIMNSLFLQAQNWREPLLVDDPQKWVAETFAKGKVPPFSFVYNGQSSASFIKKWKYSFILDSSSSPEVQKYLVSYQDPVTKLKVDCKVTTFSRFRAIEWVLNFTNEGVKNTPQISDVQAVNLGFTNNGGANYLYVSGGSDHDIKDFQLKKHKLEEGKPFHMEPQSGRSSDKTAFPFFNIEVEGKGGAIIAVGWTGTWYADVSSEGAKGIQVKAGMKGTDLYLLPQESIRTPLISMVYWSGNDYLDGHNAFRQFVLAHHSRKINGKFAEYPISGGFEWGDPAPCNEYTCLTEDMAIAFAKRYKQFGIMPEVMWLDAGWYTGAGGPNFDNVNWYNSAGTWRVDTTRFPNGLKPLSDVVHQLGAKFMVWFEPERVMAGTEFATRFPQWMLKTKENKDMFIYNLGNKEAREWLSKYIGDFLEENGIDYYRQDFNTPIQPYWDSNDEPGRKGMLQIRYIEGLYAYWDYLLERFPNLLIDNCASGGRRLDLETTSRSAPLWRTDYQYGEPNGAQNHSYGLNFYLPLHGTGVFAYDEYSFHSILSSALVLNWELTSQRGDVREMQRLLNQYKSIRNYFYEDYYPLSGLGDLTPLNVWIAYQFNKQADHSGIVVAYKRKDSKDVKQVLRLKKLDSSANYQVLNLSEGTKVIKSGKDLMNGWEVELKQTPGSAVFKYSKL